MQVTGELRLPISLNLAPKTLSHHADRYMLHDCMADLDFSNPNDQSHGLMGLRFEH